MATKVFSAALYGMDCHLIEVEADVSAALPGIYIVGLPDKAVDESRERVRLAIYNTGFEMPRRKVTINLAPADLKKAGPAYDLPIALSILQVSKQVSIPHSSRSVFVGELALDGTIRSVTGVLAVCTMAKKLGYQYVYVPRANAAEASLVSGLTVYQCSSLEEVTRHCSGQTTLAQVQPNTTNHDHDDVDQSYDMAYIIGQHHAKRALEIAAAGGHNVLFNGPPGSGKTLLAKAMTTILPNLSTDEIIEVSSIFSVAGLLSSKLPYMLRRPFRSPHHSSSGVALVGGGSWPKPGEITLAHRGVLFLDELPEFSRSVLEHLRQPLEDGVVTVSRATGSVTFPAQFTLVGAMNPCPCGFATDPDRACTCTPAMIMRYQKKISGPLLDRIDLHIEVARVDVATLTQASVAESSCVVRERVARARELQVQRYVGLNIFTNAQLRGRLIRKFCVVDEAGAELMRQAIGRLQLSVRGYDRILKVARTIADLDGCEMILQQHIAEALRYRQIHFQTM